ncbi:MAG: DUF89 family protein, partial [Candidatus Omnitrophica bacterium]|nr:DUF89 family protein [Candidatus Omnitrophota bacterium]
PGKIDVQTLELPPDIGSISDRHKGSLGKTIIHIRDVHCNYSCQRSIEGAIKFFNSEYGVGTSVLEGGSGNYDLSAFTKIKDKEVLSEVADHFVREGLVNGAELFAINEPGKMTLRGLEDPLLYGKNLLAYRESIKEKAASGNIIKRLEEYLGEVKDKVYSPELKVFDSNRSLYEEEKNGLDRYLGYLLGASVSVGVNTDLYQEFLKLAEILKSEKNIDFKAANDQREALINLLANRLSRRDKGTLVVKTLEFKEGRIKEHLFYSFLLRKASCVDIPSGDMFPELNKYAAYAAEYEGVNKEKLLRELWRLEEDIAQKLCKTGDEKELYALSRGLVTLKGLLNISITREQYERYSAIKDTLTAGAYRGFIERESAKEGMPSAGGALLSDLDIVDTFQRGIVEFYSLALERDRAFLGNITASMGTSDAAVVVTGGFHADGLKKLLADKGYSYLSVMPKVDANEDTPYLDILSGGKTGVEKMISALASSIAVPDIFSEMSGILESMGVEGFKARRDVALVSVRIIEEIASNGRVTLDTPYGYVILSNSVLDRTSSMEVGEVGGKKVFALKTTDTETTEPEKYAQIRVALNETTITHKGEEGPAAEEMPATPWSNIVARIQNAYRQMVNMSAAFFRNKTFLSGRVTKDAEQRSSVPRKVDRTIRLMHIEDSEFGAKFVPAGNINRTNRGLATKVREYEYIGESRGTLVKGGRYVMRSALHDAPFVRENIIMPQVEHYLDSSPDPLAPNPHFPLLVGTVGDRAILFEKAPGVSLKDAARSLRDHPMRDAAFLDLAIAVIEAYENAYLRYGYLNGDLDDESTLIVLDDTGTVKSVVFADNDSAAKEKSGSGISYVRKKIHKQFFCGESRERRIYDLRTPTPELCEKKDDAYSLAVALLLCIDGMAADMAGDIQARDKKYREEIIPKIRASIPRGTFLWEAAKLIDAYRRKFEKKDALAKLLLELKRMQSGLGDAYVKGSGKDNLACGTVCREGHEECVQSLDGQLEDYYVELAREYGITRDLKAEPLTSDEVITILVETRGFDRSLLEGIRRRIWDTSPEIGKRGIQVLFAIPKNGNALWWVPPTENVVDWTYAGGHFNGKGTRMHISLPLLLSGADGKTPFEIGEFVAKHDVRHITDGIHQEDEGARLAESASKGSSAEMLLTMLERVKKCEGKRLDALRNFLWLGKEASEKDILSALRQMVIKYHPDKFGSDKKRSDIANEITQKLLGHENALTKAIEEGLFTRDDGSWFGGADTKDLYRIGVTRRIKGDFMKRLMDKGVTIKGISREDGDIYLGYESPDRSITMWRGRARIGKIALDGNDDVKSVWLDYSLFPSMAHGTGADSLFTPGRMHLVEQLSEEPFFGLYFLHQLNCFRNYLQIIPGAARKDLKFSFDVLGQTITGGEVKGRFRGKDLGIVIGLDGRSEQSGFEDVATFGHEFQHLLSTAYGETRYSVLETLSQSEREKAGDFLNRIYHAYLYRSRGRAKEFVSEIESGWLKPDPFGYVREAAARTGVSEALLPEEFRLALYDARRIFEKTGSHYRAGLDAWVAENDLWLSNINDAYYMDPSELLANKAAYYFTLSEGDYYFVYRRMGMAEEFLSDEDIKYFRARYGELPYIRYKLLKAKEAGDAEGALALEEELSRLDPRKDAFAIPSLFEIINYVQSDVISENLSKLVATLAETDASSQLLLGERMISDRAGALNGEAVKRLPAPETDPVFERAKAMVLEAVNSMVDIEHLKAIGLFITEKEMTRDDTRATRVYLFLQELSRRASDRREYDVERLIRKDNVKAMLLSLGGEELIKRRIVQIGEKLPDQLSMTAGDVQGAIRTITDIKALDFARGFIVGSIEDPHGGGYGYEWKQVADALEKAGFRGWLVKGDFTENVRALLRKTGCLVVVEERIVWLEQELYAERGMTPEKIGAAIGTLSDPAALRLLIDIADGNALGIERSSMAVREKVSVGFKAAGIRYEGVYDHLMRRALRSGRYSGLLREKLVNLTPAIAAIDVAVAGLTNSLEELTASPRLLLPAPVEPDAPSAPGTAIIPVAPTGLAADHVGRFAAMLKEVRDMLIYMDEPIAREYMAKRLIGVIEGIDGLLSGTALPEPARISLGEIGKAARRILEEIGPAKASVNGRNGLFDVISAQAGDKNGAKGLGGKGIIFLTRIFIELVLMIFVRDDDKREKVLRSGTVENVIAPAIEEGLMLLALGWGGIGVYLGVRAAFVSAHYAEELVILMFQQVFNIGDPLASLPDPWEEMAIPLGISIFACLPVIAGLIWPVGLPPLLWTTGILGFIAHSFGNWAVDIWDLEYRKGMLGKEKIPGPVSIDRIGNRYKERLAALKENFKVESEAFPREYSLLIDETVSELISFYGLENKVTVVAMGSYGRMTTPYGTDLDVFILEDERIPVKESAQVKRAVERFIDAAEDVLGARFDFPAYPVDFPRMEKYLSLSAAEYEKLEKEYLRTYRGKREGVITLMALLDARYLTGPKKGVKVIKGKADLAVKQLAEKRNLNYLSRSIRDNSQQVFDPENFDIKEGRSGTRAIALMVWMGRIRSGISSWNWSKDGAKNGLIGRLVKEKFFTREEGKTLIAASDFYLGLRTASNLVWEAMGKDLERFPGRDTLTAEIIDDVAGILGKAKKTLLEEIGKNNRAVQNVLRRVVMENESVTCGTICEMGHQDELDPKLKSAYQNLWDDWVKLDRTKDRSRVLEKDPLSREEVLAALESTNKLEKLGMDRSQLQSVIDYIHANSDIPGSGKDRIDLLFAIPNEDDLDQKLLWIINPDLEQGPAEKYLYAGGHFNEAGTRIHISLALVASIIKTEGLEKAKEAALDIALHEHRHILAKRRNKPELAPSHGLDGSDRGFALVKKISESEPLVASLVEEDWKKFLSDAGFLGGIDMAVNIASKERIMAIPGIPLNIEVAASATAIGVMPASKAESLAKDLVRNKGTIKPKRIMVIADTVGTPELPGNDRSLLEITPEWLKDRGVDWEVELVRIYVGKESLANIPPGCIIAPRSGPDSTFEVYDAVDNASKKNTREWARGVDLEAYQKDLAGGLGESIPPEVAVTDTGFEFPDFIAQVWTFAGQIIDSEEYRRRVKAYYGEEGGKKYAEIVDNLRSFRAKILSNEPMEKLGDRVPEDIRKRWNYIIRDHAGRPWFSGMRDAHADIFERVLNELASGDGMKMEEAAHYARRFRDSVNLTRDIPPVPWSVAADYIFAKILEATGYWDNGVDPYVEIKEKGCAEGVEKFASNVDQPVFGGYIAQGEPGMRSALGDMLDMLLTGNMHSDPTHAAKGKKSGTYMVNDKGPVVDQLLALRDATVRGEKTEIHILHDNVGLELVSLYWFIDFCVRNNIVSKFVLLTKNYPYCVSDVSGKTDLDMQLEAMRRHGGDMAALAERIRGYMNDSLNIEIERPSWFLTSGQAISEMPEEMHSRLKKAGLIMVIGDFLYRKSMRYRNWEYTADSKRILGYYPAPTLMVRMVKSPMLAGVSSGTVSELDLRESNGWWKNPKYGVLDLIRPSDLDKIQRSYDEAIREGSYWVDRDVKMQSAARSIFTGILPADKVKGASVLDLGTGRGLIAGYAAMNGAKEVVGVDISVEMLKAAEKNLGPLRPQADIRLEQGDIARIKDRFTGSDGTVKKFDVICIGNVMHELPYTEQMDIMAQAYDLLAEGGYIVLLYRSHDYAMTPVHLIGEENIWKSVREGYLRAIKRMGAEKTGYAIPSEETDEDWGLELGDLEVTVSENTVIWGKKGGVGQLSAESDKEAEEVPGSVKGLLEEPDQLEKNSFGGAAGGALGHDRIKSVAEELNDIVNSRDATVIDRPYTIGLVVKASEGDGVGFDQRSMAVAKAKILARGFVKKMMKDKGLDADKVKVNFVFCIDDGSTDGENMERLETFKTELEKNAGAGNRAFAFVLSTDKRESSGSSGFFKDKQAWRDGKALHDVADLVALKGDYLPVSWQMLSGLLFANYIDSKKRTGEGDDDRAKAIVDDIILAVSKMTGRDPSSWKELEELKTIPANEVSDKKFNGVSIVLDLPPMKAMTGSFEECLEADQAFKKAL